MAFESTVGLLQHAAELGVNTFDVGVYGDDSPYTDVLFGSAFRCSGLARESITYCAKLWKLMGFPNTGVREQLERALMRSGLEFADLMVLGEIPSSGRGSLREILDQVADVLASGLALGWGVNNWSAPDLERAIGYCEETGVALPVINQLKYSVARRAVAEGAEHRNVFSRGVRLQASDIYEGGLLLGTPPGRRGIGQDPGGIRSSIHSAAAVVSSVALELGCTRSALCLAFTLSNDDNASSLIGVSRRSQLDDCLGAFQILDDVGGEELRRLTTEAWLDAGRVDTAQY